MYIPGLKSRAGFYGRIDRAIRGFFKTPDPQRERAFAAALKIPVRIAVGISPAVLGSLLVRVASPLFVLGSVVILYGALNPVRDQLFDFTPREKHWGITVPVHAIFLAWAAVLTLVDASEQIGRSVGGLLLLVAAAIWPVYMGIRAYKKRVRRVPFKMAFAIAAALVLVQQILILARI